MSTKKTPGTLTVFPAFGIIRRCLEREVQTGAGHSEVVVGTRDDVPADVVGPAEVRGEANFNTAADLTDRLGLAVIKLSPNRQVIDRIEEEVVRPAATEDAAAAEPEVRREARAADREAQRDGAEDAANRVRIFTALDALAGASCEDVVRFRLGDPALHTETEVAMNKVFRIDRTAPAVIDRQIAVVAPVVARPDIGATQRHVALVVRVPLWAGRRGDTLRFLGIGLASISGSGHRDRRAQAKG